MAQQSFTLATNMVRTNSGGAQGTIDLFVSQNIQNNNNLPNCRLVVIYDDISPDNSLNAQKTFGLTAVLEALLDGKWFPVAYQFEPFQNPDNGRQRIIVMQQDVQSFDAGIDDVVYVAESTVARISRQQGKAAATMRVRIILRENDANNVGAFSSVSLTVFGELYDAA
jgi:mannose/fructose/N-acetylgalactosamine-specific phosphotransferase system component IIB